MSALECLSGRILSNTYNPSMHLIRFNKPYRVLSQFTDADSRPTLADYIDLADLYPAGRLDFESEGLMLLTNDGRLQARISDPRFKLAKTYLVQVEGKPRPTDLQPLQSGVQIKGDFCRAESARCMTEPDFLWPREPPIRARKSIPTSWIAASHPPSRSPNATSGRPAVRPRRLPPLHAWTHPVCPRRTCPPRTR